MHAPIGFLQAVRSHSVSPGNLDQAEHSAVRNGRSFFFMLAVFVLTKCHQLLRTASIFFGMSYMPAFFCFLPAPVQGQCTRRPFVPVPVTIPTR